MANFVTSKCPLFKVFRCAGYEAGMLQAGAQAAVSGVVAAPEYYYPQVSCTTPGFC